MSGATESGDTEAFAQLLRELKVRSGLSYGVLAKRLHMSTSTLHRYCNGTAVPVDYAPVERLARVCRATPQELVELHRRWILADAARSRKAAQAAAETAEAGAAERTVPADGPEAALSETDGVAENEVPAVVDLPAGPAPSRPRRRLRRRTALIASVAVVAALGSLVYVLRPTSERTADTSAPTSTRSADAGASGQPSSAPPTGRKTPGPSASASNTPTGKASSQAAGSGSGQSDSGQGASSSNDPVPLTVSTRPYVYDSPCSQHFLVDSEPSQVGPPAPSEQDAPRWAAAYGAVSSGEQEVALTVQGTGAETVVLEALHVRVLSKAAPLAWNDYSMGVGCGGGVDTKSFDIALDGGSPTVTVKGGQRDFPYKVSESDPEVFYVVAHTTAHDVRWDLTLDWSSGSRHGTVHVDNAGTPFRTSADVGRPGYDYPLGGGEWIKRES
ncbi:helix-turn-helix domain-containing protein [Streptomyces sp. NPDC101152]|uniref:transcriptional regulator n=1 Tax=Streptomyces sp. NPDC101152 TaxID=3366116 RepID=UPI0038200D73